MATVLRGAGKRSRLEEGGGASGEEEHDVERMAAQSPVVQERLMEAERGRLRAENELIDCKSALERSNARLKMRQEEYEDLQRSASSERHHLQTLLDQAHERYEKALEELSVIRSELETSEDYSSGKTSSLRKQVYTLEGELSLVRVENEKLQAQVHDLGARLAVSQDDAKMVPSLESKCMMLELRLKSLERELAADSGVVVSQSGTPTQSEIARARKISQENESLRRKNLELSARVESLQQMEAENDSLRVRLENLTSASDLTSLQLQVATLEEELQAWRSSFADFDTPVELAVKMRCLQAQNLQLLESKGELAQEVSNLKLENQSLQKELESLEEEKTWHETSGRNSKSLVETMQRECTLLRQEKKSMEDILDSFGQEGEAAGQENVVERINELKDLLQETESERQQTHEEAFALKQRLMEVESEIEVLRIRSQTAEKRAARLEEELEDQKRQFDRLGRQRDRLEETVASLEARVGRGEFNRARTKVLHLTRNPASMAHASCQEIEMEELRQLNKVLTKKVDELQVEVSGLQSQLEADIGGSVSSFSSAGDEAAHVERVEHRAAVLLGTPEIEQLRSKVGDLERLNNRLREVFRAKSQEFRNAVVLLFGYEVEMVEEKTYKLTSLYADKEEEYLMFEMSDENEMTLLESDFANTLQEEIQAYLNRCSSFPAFLANVTLKLFENQTAMM